MSLLTPKELKNRQIASYISLIVGTALMFFKFWAFNLTKSEAIRSDALESIVNVVTAGLAILVVYVASKPADQDHPYGHGKVEYFSAAFEGGLISFAAVMIVIEGIRALLGEPQLKNLGTGLVIVTFCGIINLLLSLYLMNQGKKNKSAALYASGKHVLSDAITSAGVLLGVFIVYVTGALWLDSILAILVGLYLGLTGIKLVFDSIGGLMDKEDEGLLNQLAIAFRKSRAIGIIKVFDVKIIRSGHYHHIDARVILPEFWSVLETHQKLNQLEEETLLQYSHNGDIHFQIESCQRDFCKMCDLENCPVRKEKFIKLWEPELAKIKPN
jgi:cation diffusion facilitator family transporter